MSVVAAMESTENTERLAKCVKSNKTLGTKKLNRKKKKLRNIILNPTDKFWPSLNSEENDKFNCVMNSVINYYSAECNKKSEREWKKDLTIGVNETAAQKDLIWAVVLENDVDPRFLIEHVVYLCARKGITVLIVSSLRESTRALFGFSSIALGFKKQTLTILRENEQSSPLYELCKVIKELGKAHQPSESFPDFCEPAPYLNNPKTPQLSNIALSQNDRKQNCDKSNFVPRFYLLKPRSGRAFIPKPQNKEIESESESVSEEDSKKRPATEFISLSAGITAGEVEDGMEDEFPRGISSSVVNKNKKSKIHKGSSSTFIPLRYVEVQPKPKKKKL